MKVNYMYKKKESSPETSNLRIGEMPRAQYISGVPSPFPNNDKIIGVLAFSSKTRELKPFAWWDNIQVNINDKINRGTFIQLFARIIMDLDTDVVIGPAISLSKSDPQTGKVEPIHVWPVIGIYVEPAKRLGFEFTTSKLESASSLKKIDPVKWNSTLANVKSVLPHL
jgi:hypothetical protein